MSSAVQSIIPNPPHAERSPRLPERTDSKQLLANAGASWTGVTTLALNHQEVQPVRCTPSLQAPQGPLVDFLTGGYGYDDQSVSEAVRQGNEHFEKRELAKASDFFGAAYEIGRLHFDYKPLMHDLVVRRILCYSMLGDLQQALHEYEIAIRVIPHSATVLLLAGVVYSKLGDADNANQCFQHAVAQCRELRDLIDCVVATFMLAQGHCDRAIQICSQVLSRKPRYAFALLVRGDAYKFHASGYFTKQAADDYTALLDIDPNLQELSGKRLTQQDHARLDELVLRFHPRLQKERPRSYDQYPMCSVYRKRRPFLVAAFVVFATAKLKTCVRSTQLVQNVQQRNEELLLARAAAERKVRQLAETQQKLAALESSAFSEVWGPADPDHCHARRYRRYWMERPLNFPKRRGQAAGGADHEEEMTPPHSRSPSPPKRRDDLPRGHMVDQGPPPPISPSSESRGGLNSEHAPALLFSQTGADQHLKHRIVLAEPDDMGRTQTQEALYGPSGPLGAADLLLASREPATPPHPTAKKLSTERAFVEKPPLQKLGHDWGESQWLAKALELADAFGGVPSDAAGHLPNALAHRDGHPADTVAAMLRSQEPVDPKVPLPPSLAVVRVPAAGGQVHGVNLTEAIEDFGFDVFPNWFSTLDRIYEVSDMQVYRSEPEGLAAAPGLAGAPGYSYVVPKSGRREKGLRPKSPRSGDFPAEHGAPAGGYAGEAGWSAGYMGGGGVQQLDEAVARRYQNKLLSAGAPGRAAMAPTR